jgi:transposase
MIVIGVDMHKQSLPAAAVEETGRLLAERTLSGSEGRSLGRVIAELERELTTLTAQTAPALLELPGCGALTAAKLLYEIGPIERFRTDAQLARHGGVAPLEASSGRTRRYRLDRGGTRQLNCALHRIAVTQARMHPPAAPI